VTLNPNVVDVTEDSSDEIIAFAPYLRLIGYNAITERRKNSNALFYRAVEDRQSSERCLQYLYIYKQQSGVIERETLGVLLWIWIHLLLIPIIQYHSLLDSLLDNGGIIIIASILGIYLFSFGMESHFEDLKKIRKGIRFRARVRTPFILFGFLVVVTGMNPTFGIPWYSIGSIILIIYFLLEKWKLVRTSHQMDYAPVFVYIRKEMNTWKFIKACWDKGHYHVDGYYTDSEINERLKAQKRIMLKIDNLWHDFTPLLQDEDEKYQSQNSNPKRAMKQHQEYLRNLLIIALTMSFFEVLLLVFELLQNIQISLYVSPTLIFLGGEFFLAGIFFHHYICYQTKPDHRAKVLDFLYSLHLGLPEHYLSHTKLEMLWKLEKGKMRLKIQDVMQNPFRQGSECFDKFDR
jgi:hypothetical protein